MCSSVGNMSVGKTSRYPMSWRCDAIWSDSTFSRSVAIFADPTIHWKFIPGWNLTWLTQRRRNTSKHQIESNEGHKKLMFFQYYHRLFTWSFTSENFFTSPECAGTEQILERQVLWKSIWVCFNPAVSFEPGMAGYEVRTLPLCYAVPPFTLEDIIFWFGSLNNFF